MSQADQDIRHSLGRLVGSPLSDDDWRVASIGVASGGLVARSALEHAPAAYLSSLVQTQEISLVSPIATRSLTSASIVSLGPERGFFCPS